MASKPKASVAAQIDSVAEETITTGTAVATTGIEQAKTQTHQGVHRAMKSAEQLAQFSQGNIEAFVKSSQILTNGWTELSKLVAANAKASMEETMSTFKALSSVKSVKEAYELQTAFAKSNLEKVVAESGKITEHSLKLAEQAMAPLTARVNAAVETFS